MQNPSMKMEQEATFWAAIANGILPFGFFPKTLLLVSLGWTNKKAYISKGGAPIGAPPVLY